MSDPPLDPYPGSAGSGDPVANPQLFRVLYGELRRIAERELRRSGGASPLSPTTVLHEAYIAMAGRQSARFSNRPQRFVREGSVLAALQHPNIAHLIDAGVSAGGQPYLVLEYVEGISIDEYCDDNRLGIRARLRVFLDVLEAVAYAHHRLIVHRDLKPSNILVTRDGVVKLLDFGIATLLEPVTGAQAGRELYGLLGGPQTTMPQGQSAIRDTLEREQPLLSEAVPEAGMQRLLRGDLDNIVRKALKNEPVERYATVEAFADDLRHLSCQ